MEQLFLVIILIIINGFFAMAEIALIKVKKNRLQNLKKNGSKKAAITLGLLENSKQFLSTIQIGITFAGFLASAATAANLAQPIAELLNNIPLLLIKTNSQFIAVLLTTALISYLSLVFGELVPKQIALQWSQKISLFVALPIKYLGIIASPLVNFLSFSTKIVLKIIPGAEETKKTDKVTEEDIKSMLHNTQLIEDIEKDMIEGVFTFGDTRVEEIMTPRTDIIYLHKNQNLEETLALIEKSDYSRYPIVNNSLDEVLGIIHIRDLAVKLYHNSTNTNIVDMSRPALFVPESKMASKLLKEFQSKNIHMAIVINEYGGTSGLITLEDLLEEIVGDIQDEYDKEKGQINKIDNTHISIKGNTDIGFINKNLGTNIPDTVNYETIAGFILHRLNHIPKPGEDIEVNGWTIVITDVNQNRIEKVKFIKNDSTASENSSIIK
ncbi:MAG: hemolysin family protein [Halanaerobiales bacterium]